MSQPTEPTIPNPYAPPSEVENVGAPAVALPMEGEIRALFDRGKNGAAWFYWIAGLSLISSLIALSGGNIRFVLGLAVTTIADGVAAGAVEAGNPWSVKLIALGFDLFVYALVAGCGWLSQKRILPVFALGMGLYLLDGLLFLLFFDIVAVGIHAFALWSMWNGFTAYRQVNILEQRMLTGAAGGP
jgi:hypothetical protein